MNYPPNTQEDEWEQREAHWGRKHQELESRIRQLAIKKQQYFRQKQALSQLKTRQIQEVPVGELRSLLELAQDEIQDLHRTCELERRKSDEISKEMSTLKDRCELLEKTNRSLTTLLVEKDNLLHSLIADSQMGQMQNEKYLPYKIQDKAGISFTDTMSESIGEEGNIYKPQQAIGKKLDPTMKLKMNKLADEYSSKGSTASNIDIYELKNLYRKSTEQIKQLNDILSKKDQDLKKLKMKLDEVRQDFNSLSSQLVKENVDGMIRGSGLEIEQLRKENEEYENNLKKIELRYKVSLDQLESDLASSRKKVLELLDEKSQAENTIFRMKEDTKKLQEAMHVKELKISELQVSLSDIQTQLSDLQDKILKNDASQANQAELQLKASQETIQTLREYHASAESKLAALQIENSELREQLENLESELTTVSPSKINESVLNAIQELSLIILSKEKANTLDFKTKQLVHQIFGDNFSNIVEAYEKQLKVLYSEKQELRDILREEVEKRISGLNSLNDLVDFIFKLAEILLKGDIDGLASELSIRHDDLEILGEKTSEALEEANSMLYELNKANVISEGSTNY
jgi:chromosome segregation ATPase